MDPTAFESWLSEIAALTEPQRRRALEALGSSATADSPAIEICCQVEQDAFGVAEAAAVPPNPARAASVAEPGQRRVDSVGCPHCNNGEVVRWGHASDLPRYRCKSCLRTFNALTRTPLANLRMKDKWASEHAREGTQTAA